MHKSFMRQTTSKVLVNRSHRTGKILADNVSLAQGLRDYCSHSYTVQYRQGTSITGCLSRFGSKDDRCNNPGHAE